MRTGPNIRARADGRYEARYEKARDEAGRIVYGYCYGRTYEEAERKRRDALRARNGKAPREARRMNLLILGAGSQGLVVREIAQMMHVFHEIAFLDDDPENPFAMGPCGSYREYAEHFPIAIPSFGDCALRAEWLEKLTEAGFVLPVLIHPQAVVSPGAEIGEGSVVEMKAMVEVSARIGAGCILSSGSIVEAGAAIGENSLLNSASVVKRSAVVPPFTELDSGAVFEETERYGKKEKAYG